LKPIIISYPRSGRNYLHQILNNAFEKNFAFSHVNNPEKINELNNYNYLIALVRNPIDSISSIVAMNLEFNKDLEINNLINYQIKEYIKFYSFALENADTFIDFNSIANNINKVIEYVSIVTNYTILNNKPNNNIIKDFPDGKFLKTSKKTEKYNDIVFSVKNKDLNECFKLYQKALERCVKIDAL
jgi:hypothetical protein